MSLAETAVLLLALQRDAELACLGDWVLKSFPVPDDNWAHIGYTLAAIAYRAPMADRDRLLSSTIAAFRESAPEAAFWRERDEIDYIEWLRLPAPLRKRRIGSAFNIAHASLWSWVFAGPTILLDASLEGIRRVATGEGAPPRLSPGRLENPLADPLKESNHFLRQWKSDFAGRIGFSTSARPAEKLRDLACLLAALGRWSEVAELANWTRRKDPQLSSPLASLAAFPTRQATSSTTESLEFYEKTLARGVLEEPAHIYRKLMKPDCSTQVIALCLRIVRKHIRTYHAQ